MRSGFGRWSLLLVTVVGCSASAPPFDELPLRDALRADPEVVAALPDDARARLASRFQAAGASDTGADPAGATASIASAIAQVDLARQRRAADALVIGTVGGGSVQALPSGTQAIGAVPLPPLEGVVATTTAVLETRALAGAAGASLRELLAASHASRMERVVGWPVAAVAAGDTAYVNGAWLVAMAAPAADAGTSDAGACDAGVCDGGAPAGSGGSSMTTGPGEGFGGRRGTGGGGGRWAGTGGTPWTPPSTWTPPTPPPDPNTSNTNSTSDNVDVTVGTCDGSSDDGTDSCDGSSDDGSEDSCSNSSDDGSQDSCNAQDDGGTSDCATAPRRRRPDTGTVIWLLAPLAYLFGREPSKGSRTLPRRLHRAKPGSASAKGPKR